MSTETDHSHLCGWIPDPAGADKYANHPERKRAFADSRQLTPKGVDTFLWLALMAVCPNWRRGSQGIGDCVSWGAELVITMLLAIMAKLGKAAWEAEAATEPIYGGSRVEADGGGLGGYSDGSNGFSAAAWLHKWGALLRIDYSKQTGVAEHDLTKYSSSKAKAWGNFGCGGRNDGGRGQGLLDKVAAVHPVADVTKVESTSHCAALLENGYLVSVASNVGYGSMRRDANGVVRRSGSWNHQMMFGGVRWVNGKPQFRLFQSWGNSASGPDPGIEHEAISACSWWITEEDAAVMIGQGDTWGFSDVQGFKPRRLDWAHAKVIA